MMYYILGGILAIGFICFSEKLVSKFVNFLLYGTTKPDHILK